MVLYNLCAQRAKRSLREPQHTQEKGVGPSKKEKKECLGDPTLRRPRCVQCAYRARAARVGNNSYSKQDRQFIVIVFTVFAHSTPPHCAIEPSKTAGDLRGWIQLPLKRDA